MLDKNSVWFITGANKGLGAAVTKKALEMGYKVVAAVRKTEQIEKLFGKNENLLPVYIDLNDNDKIKVAVNAAIEKFGKIDVLVNNAGYGLLGYFEEFSDQQVRSQIETNVFGTMSLTREVLPYMREKRSGYVVTISSTSGIKAVEGDSIYAASKFALEGWMEGINFEVTQFGIKCMIVEPGAFRTDFFKEGTSFVFSDLKIKDYDEMRARLYKHFTKWDGKQDGNPEKFAIALMKGINADEPPFRLLISKSAVPAVDAYYTARYAEFKKWEEVSLDTAFDDEE